MAYGLVLQFVNVKFVDNVVSGGVKWTATQQLGGQGGMIVSYSDGTNSLTPFPWGAAPAGTTVAFSHNSTLPSITVTASISGNLATPITMTLNNVISNNYIFNVRAKNGKTLMNQILSITDYNSISSQVSSYGGTFTILGKTAVSTNTSKLGILDFVILNSQGTISGTTSPGTGGSNINNNLIGAIKAGFLTGFIALVLKPAGLFKKKA